MPTVWLCVRLVTKDGKDQELAVKSVKLPFVVAGMAVRGLIDPPYFALNVIGVTVDAVTGTYVAEMEDVVDDPIGAYTEDYAPHDWQLLLQGCDAFSADDSAGRGPPADASPAWLADLPEVDCPEDRVPFAAPEVRLYADGEDDDELEDGL